MKCPSRLAYGILAYLVFWLTLIYAVGFFGNLVVPRTIDGSALVPLPEALAVNLGLLLSFALQHSGMARQSFKRWLHDRLSPCLERSTYVLASSLAMLLLFVFWQPMGGVIWAVADPLAVKGIYALYFLGWGIMAVATFLIDHLEMLGLRQAWVAYHSGDCREPEFRTPGLYRHVRHPIYLGWLLVLWAAPVMTVTHLICAAGLTIYILIGIQFEERDLAAELPEYEQYRRKVPMLLPSLRRRLLQDAE